MKISNLLFLFLLPLIKFSAASSSSSNGDQLASQQRCDVESLPSTIDQLSNPGQDPVAFLYAEGVRFFNCSTGTPSPASGGLVNVTDGGLMGDAGLPTNWRGFGIYPDMNENGTFVLQEIYSNTGVLIGDTFNITLDYSTVLFIDSPDGMLPWARWLSFSAPARVQDTLNFGWGSRVDTAGGAIPQDCGKQNAEGMVIVPYQSYYYFYPCPGSENGGATSGAAAGGLGMNIALIGAASAALLLIM